MFAVDEPHLSLSHMEPPGGDEVSIAPPQLEGEAAAAMRPSVMSGYSKQFQKSLPPRFLRQQVKLSQSSALISSRLEDAVMTLLFADGSICGVNLWSPSITRI